MSKKRYDQEQGQYDEEVFAPVSKEEFDTAVKELAQQVDTEVMEFVATPPTSNKGLFNIKTTSDDVIFRKFPSMKDTAENMLGKMKANKTYLVTEIITYTPMRMYRLENGYYIIADQRINIL